MEEHQVTVDGNTYPLGAPFMVIATQNPIEMEGTYALPEAQRDRFTARVSIGYPDPQAELAMVDEHAGHNPLDDLRPVSDAAQILRLIEAVRRVHLSPRSAGTPSSWCRPRAGCRSCGWAPRRDRRCTSSGPPVRRPRWPAVTSWCRTTSTRCRSRCWPTGWC